MNKLKDETCNTYGVLKDISWSIHEMVKEDEMYKIAQETDAQMGVLVLTSYAALICLNFSSDPGFLFISGWYC